ncbi:hypothetical protein F2Q70_00037291 [Brassica cretica]|uniref:Uncharacterized protein n=1 Tax=Brassica cretica TaxID=69181 RepID=A0A8S9JV40_BRACR|nr:hypothetical protein F2Q70_00037291 [Brassica cretica]
MKPIIKETYKEYFGDASELTPIPGYLQRLRTVHPDRLSWWRCRCSGDMNQVRRGPGMSGMEFIRRSSMWTVRVLSLVHLLQVASLIQFGYVTDYQRDYKEYFGDASELTPIPGYLQRLRTAHPDRLSWWRCRCSGDRNQVCRGPGMSGMEFFRRSCTACLYDEGRMIDCLDWPHNELTA